MTKAILVTHALTAWNEVGRIQGHTDLPLSETGRVMAERLCQYLEGDTIHAVYASDLSRALETAHPFAVKKGLSITRDIRLREGRSAFQERSDQYPTLPFSKEVENEEDVLLRMIRAMDDIGRSHEGETVLVVSHGAAVELFINHVLSEQDAAGLVYGNIRMAINRLFFDGRRWQCVSLNDAAHLISPRRV